MMQIRLALVAVLPLWLAACDGVAVDPSDVDARNQLAAEYTRQNNLYGPAFIVPANQLRNFGTATYDGVARIVVDTVATTEILGEAEIEVDFFSDDVDAEFGNFFGRESGGPVTAWVETVPVRATGEIDVTQPGGRFIQTTMTGTLQSALGDTLRFNPGNQLDGTFRDTAPSSFSPPDALVLNSGPGSINLNGLNYGNESGTNCETCVWVIAED